MQLLPPGHDRQLLALAGDACLAERQRRIAEAAAHSVQPPVLDEDHRVGIADGLDQQVMGVGDRSRHHDLQAGDVGEHRLERLGVLGAGAAARPRLGPEDDRDRERAGGHVAELRRLVEDRVQADPDEVHEHDLDDRPQAGHRRADGGADVAHLADRRIQDTVGTEPVIEPLRDGEDPAAGADVDPDQHDRVVLGHRVGHALVERVDVARGHLCGLGRCVSR